MVRWQSDDVFVVVSLSTPKGDDDDHVFLDRCSSHACWFPAVLIGHGRVTDGFASRLECLMTCSFQNLNESAVLCLCCCSMGKTSTTTPGQQRRREDSTKFLLSSVATVVTRISNLRFIQLFKRVPSPQSNLLQ